MTEADYEKMKEYLSRITGIREYPTFTTPSAIQTELTKSFTNSNP